MHIDEKLLRRVAGDKSFERGCAYARDGAVEIDSRDDSAVEASVEGTQTYRVRLVWRGGVLHGECDCPVGDAFCKHQVATALVWSGNIADEEKKTDTPTAAKTASRSRKSADDDKHILRDWLDALDPVAVRDLLIDFAQRDRDVWRQLVARARVARSAPAEWRRAIGDLIGRKRFLDYRQTVAYAQRLTALPNILRDALARDPSVALNLADHALHRLIAVYEQVDDSSGALGDVLHDIGALYRDAALAARPSAEKFAKDWIALREIDDWGIVGKVGDYADLLGGKGIALLEKFVHAKLDAMPPSKAKWDESDMARRLWLRLLEELAGNGGDIDALLAIKARAAHEAHDYLELARLNREHGRERQAIEWLERGLKVHPSDQRLLATLAETYMREGFDDDARKLHWRQFAAIPSDENFLILRKHAGGEHAWRELRERAYAQVRDQGAGDLDRLIHLHLADGDAAGAWALTDDRAALRAPTWAALGHAIERDNPEGALRCYRTLVAGVMDRYNLGNPDYDEAVTWLAKMLPLHARLKTLPAFAAYVRELRETYRAKRNFVARVDALIQSQDLRYGSL